jgi:hypothetical protein
MDKQFDIVGHLKLEETMLKTRLADLRAEMLLVYQPRADTRKTIRELRLYQSLPR